MARTDTIPGLSGLPAVQGYNHAVLLERIVLLLYIWCANATEKRMPTWALLLIALSSTHHPYDVSLAQMYYPWRLRSCLYPSKILKSVSLIHKKEHRRK
jgi:hypothetical protein